MTSFVIAWFLSQACPSETAWIERDPAGGFRAACGDSDGVVVTPQTPWSVLYFRHARTVSLGTWLHLPAYLPEILAWHAMRIFPGHEESR